VGIGLTSLGFAAAIPALQRESEPKAETLVQQCDPAEAPSEMAKVWSPERRNEIEAAFVATGLPYAKPAAETTLAGLDAWTKSWTQARAQACSSRDAEEARLSLVCLDRNRASFAELVSVLAQADATAVDIANEVLEELPAVEACADFELPVDERARSSSELAKLGELEARVDRISLLWMIARTDEALALADAVLREAEALDAKTTIAQVRQYRGLLRLDTGEHELAIDELLNAALAARRAERPDLEAECWMNIADAETRIGVGDSDRWLDIAAFAVALADTPELRFDLANHRGLVARTQGKPREALEWFEQSLGQLEGALETRPVRHLKGLANLSVVLTELDQPERAWAVANESLELAEHNWPPGHPELGILYNTRASIQKSRGEFEAAKHDFQRAYELLNTNFGAEHLYTRTVTARMATVEAELGNCDEARRMLDELIPVLRDDPNVALLLPNALVWRSLLCDQTQPDSRALADEALERAKLAYPDGSLGLAMVVMQRAWTLLALEDHAAAELAFRAAEPALVARLPEGHIDRAELLGGLGAALAGMGRPEEARPLLEQGIAGLGKRRPLRTARLQRALAELPPAR
jgi:tetratricopeptide (TPR) repeat protein